MARQLETLTVKELMNQLENLDPDMPVVFEHETGNYWGQTLGVPVRGIQRTELQYDDYNRGFKVIESYDDELDQDEDLINALMIV